LIIVCNKNHFPNKNRKLFYHYYKTLPIFDTGLPKPKVYIVIKRIEEWGVIAPGE